MRITNGISCKVNQYTVMATAIVDGEVKSYTFDTDTRDARAAKKSVADALGIPASKVLVDFKLEKKNFVIETDYENLVKVLTDNGISVSVDSEE
jgi:hypothetical protein